MTQLDRPGEARLCALFVYRACQPEKHTNDLHFQDEHQMLRRISACPRGVPGGILGQVGEAMVRTTLGGGALTASVNLKAGGDGTFEGTIKLKLASSVQLALALPEVVQEATAVCLYTLSGCVLPQPDDSQGNFILNSFLNSHT